MKSEALVAAFEATSYRVETDQGTFDLRIGIKHPAFDEYLRQRKVSRWGLITACNPKAVRCDADNQERQILLHERLKLLGRMVLDANNVADDGVWPDEKSVLVLQPREVEMRRLASEFSQLAYVWGRYGTEPQLVWI